mgnify:CR=1 FL=1
MGINHHRRRSHKNSSISRATLKLIDIRRRKRSISKSLNPYAVAISREFENGTGIQSSPCLDLMKLTIRHFSTVCQMDPSEPSRDRAAETRYIALRGILNNPHLLIFRSVRVATCVSLVELSAIASPPGRWTKLLSN